MKKLITTGVVLALLVSFMMPMAVTASDRCEYEPPDCPPLPEKTTRTMAGAAVWTALGATDIMGTAVAQTTGMLACNLGGWSDELGIVAMEGVSVILQGVAGLLPAVGEMIGMAELLEPVADILAGLAELFIRIDG